ncbi:MAG: hypothetical protein J4215_00855 [Candidatus Diapherotrites archaeon]|uniref:Uncharacterized protein n=1 Tax=Candidatus Iainarchaeum sp. TaxID=3101447 RepID=A0A8T4L5G8_9ARCH|nr:hypothetical protein [Candidatus Diapherotrites archaeon]
MARTGSFRSRVSRLSKETRLAEVRATAFFEKKKEAKNRVKNLELRILRLGIDGDPRVLEKAVRAHRKWSRRLKPLRRKYAENRKEKIRKNADLERAKRSRLSLPVMALRWISLPSEKRDRIRHRKNYKLRNMDPLRIRLGAKTTRLFELQRELKKVVAGEAKAVKLLELAKTKLQEDGLLEPELSRRNKWFRLASADLAQRKKDSEALRRAVEQQRLVVDGIREKRSRFPLNVMRLARAKKAVRNRLARFQKNAGESGQKKRKTTR